MNGETPIACKLDVFEARAQLERWRKVGAGLVRMESIHRGFAMWFDNAVADDVRAVAAIEAECCDFLDLTVTGFDNQIRLQITSTEPEGLPVIELLVDRIHSDARI